MSDSYVKVTLIKSQLGKNPKHRKTLRALGLRKMWARRRHKVTPVLNGMIKQVKYLVRVEEDN